jgi:protein kinase-like protein
MAGGPLPIAGRAVDRSAHGRFKTCSNRAVSGLPREGDLYGRFQIRRLIGRGGMGAVFEAYDPTVRRLVAVKVVLPGTADIVDSRERFDREEQLLARLRSSHIVHIHDVGRLDDSLYLVTELAPDGDLVNWVAEHDGGHRPEPGFLTSNFESSYATTADTSRKTPGPRSLVMVGVVAAALVAAALGGYAIVNAANGTDRPSASTGTSKGPAATAATPDSAATATAGAVGGTPTPIAFTCWDGSEVGSADQCKPLRGTRAFYWIFPGMDGQNCRPRTADNTPGRAELLECFLNDRRVKIHLSLWDSADAGISHYTIQEGLGQPQANTDANGVPTRYAWNGVAYRYQGVFLWPTHAYSAAVYAASNAELASVLQHPTLLKPVPDDQYFGRPSG